MGRTPSRERKLSTKGARVAGALAPFAHDLESGDPITFK